MPLCNAGSAQASAVTWTARTGWAGRRGCIEIQTRRVLAFLRVSVATSEIGPVGRFAHDSRNRPLLETRTGRPFAVRVAPGSSVPARAIG